MVTAVVGSFSEVEAKTTLTSVRESPAGTKGKERYITSEEAGPLQLMQKLMSMVLDKRGCWFTDAETAERMVPGNRGSWPIDADHGSSSSYRMLVVSGIASSIRNS